MHWVRFYLPAVLLTVVSVPLRGLINFNLLQFVVPVCVFVAPIPIFKKAGLVALVAGGTSFFADGLILVWSLLSWSQLKILSAGLMMISSLTLVWSGYFLQLFQFARYQEEGV